MTESDRGPRVEIFGDLRLIRDGAELDLGPPRQRLLLAELVAAQGRPIGLERLVDCLWGDEPPDSAINQVHRYIGELRRNFEPDLSTRAVGAYVAPAAGGYRLLTDSLSSDLTDFRVKSYEAVQLALQGTPSATNAYVDLLRLVRRPAFDDLPFGAASRPEFAEIERDRLHAVGKGADFALLGGDVEVLARLIEGIAASAPADERLQARTIRLLAAQGRIADALDLFERTRHRLADDFGVGPGAELAEAHRVVMLGDETLIGQSVTAVGVNTLPPRSLHYLPRNDEQAELRRALEKTARDGSALVVLSGMAGIGKTTLATNWAHDAEVDFPSGRLYIDLRGFTPDGAPMDTTMAINTLLADLGVQLQDLDPNPAYRRSLYQTRLADGKYLVVLDNARDSDQVRPLLPHGRGSMVIVTSRDSATSLVVHEGASYIAIERLTEDQAAELITNRLGPRITDEPGALTSILNACAGLPLALSIVAARANLQRDWSMTDVAADLTSSKRKFNALRAGSADSDVRAAFNWSHQLLSEGAAHLFARLAVHPGTQFSISFASTIAGDGPKIIEPILDELVTSSMVSRSVGGLFEMHDLIRLFAIELLETGDVDQPQRALVHYVMSTMLSTFRLMMIADTNFALPRATSVVTEEPLTSVIEAEAWFLRERQTLTAALAICRAQNLDVELSALILVSWPARFFEDEWKRKGADLTEEALAAARRSGAHTLEAEALRQGGFLKALSGDSERASADLSEAARLFKQDNNKVGIVNVAQTELSARLHRGEYDEVACLSSRLMQAARSSGDDNLIVAALTLASEAAACLRDWNEVIELSDEAQGLSPQIFEHAGRAFAANVAVALNMVGRHQDARNLLLPLIGPREQDSMFTFGLLTEMAIAASETAEVELAELIRLRLLGYFEKFGKRLVENYPEKELDWILDRVGTAMRKIGLGPITIELTSEGHQ